MTTHQTEELAALRERFPHIQEIYADSMEWMMLSGGLMSAAIALLALGHPWTWVTMSWRIVGAGITAYSSHQLAYSANEEDAAIKRYFSLMKMERASKMLHQEFITTEAGAIRRN